MWEMGVVTQECLRNSGEVQILLEPRSLELSNQGLERARSGRWEGGAQRTRAAPMGLREAEEDKTYAAHLDGEHRPLMRPGPKAWKDVQLQVGRQEQGQRWR